MAKRKRKFNFQSRRNKSAEDQRLALLAQELGVAMLMVLIDYGFSKDQANEMLDKVLQQAKTNRLMISTNTVLAAYDALNKDAS